MASLRPPRIIMEDSSRKVGACPKRPTLAVQYFQKAADQGETNAMVNLARPSSSGEAARKMRPRPDSCSPSRPARATRTPRKS